MKIHLIPAIGIVLACSSFGYVSYADQTDDPEQNQKAIIEHMHHQLHRDQAPFKAKEAQSLQELNEMTITDTVDLEALDAKIEELMAAKKEIMRLRYHHLVEMRAILSPEQRIQYDRAVLDRSEVR